MPSLHTLWLIFYRRGRKEGTETTETKYYFEPLLGLRLLILPLPEISIGGHKRNDYFIAFAYREIAFGNNKTKNRLENGDNQMPGLLACTLLAQAFDLRNKILKAISSSFAHLNAKGANQIVVN